MLTPLNTKSVPPGTLRDVMVIPTPEASSGVDPLKFVAVSTIFDIVLLKEAAVAAFSDVALLKAVLPLDSLMGLRFVLLEGYPASTYSPAFEQLCWQLDRASYDMLVSDLVAAKRLDDVKKNDAGAKVKRTSKPLGVIEPKSSSFTRFDVHKADGSSESDTKPMNEEVENSGTQES